MLIPLAFNRARVFAFSGPYSVVFMSSAARETGSSETSTSMLSTGRDQRQVPEASVQPEGSQVKFEVSSEVRCSLDW